MFLVYSLLFTVGVVLTAPYYLWRLRGHIFSLAGWRERFGFLPESFRPRAFVDGANGPTPVADRTVGGSIWIHAVSVGETLAVAGLVRELHRRYPARRIFMSHVTPAGRETGEKRLPSPSSETTAASGQASPVSGARSRGNPSNQPPVAGRFFLPLDWGWCVGRALRRIQPAMLVIAETELWPNLIRSAHRRGARVALVNARLSERSYRGYRRFRFFFKRVLERIDVVAAQTPRDAERFRLLGVPTERVTVTGNMKFDGASIETGPLPGILGKALEKARRGPVFVVASTMPGEEPLVLEAWQDIRHRHPQALLILAPRHPARFESVCQLLSDKGLTFLRRTALAAGGEESEAQLAAPEILLLDTIGELAGIFQLADLVFMGGSLVPTGGHNLLEPAYWGRAILFGPHMHNFRDIAQMFREAEAAIEVQSAAELAGRAVDLLDDEQARRTLGDRARQVMQREAGATARVVEQLDKCLRSDAQQ